MQYFEDDCNQRLVASLEERAEELAALRTPQRVRLALRARLEMLIPFMGAPQWSSSAYITIKLLQAKQRSAAQQQINLAHHYLLAVLLTGCNT